MFHVYHLLIAPSIIDNLDMYICFKLSYYNEYKSYLRYETLKLREPYKWLMADVFVAKVIEHQLSCWQLQF